MYTILLKITYSILSDDFSLLKAAVTIILFSIYHRSYIFRYIFISVNHIIILLHSRSECYYDDNKTFIVNHIALGSTIYSSC